MVAKKSTSKGSNVQLTDPPKSDPPKEEKKEERKLIIAVPEFKDDFEMIIIKPENIARIPYFFGEMKKQNYGFKTQINLVFSRDLLLIFEKLKN